MSEYWKSTGKWYCELCKCWTGDNKASIEFHERGKKHAEAKKRRIIEAKRDAIGKRKKDEKDAGMFAKMEREALKAVQKDVASGLAGRGDLKKIVAAHSGAKEDSRSIDTYPWSEMDTPQGFKYYYNSLTGESTWIVPEPFKKIEKERKLKESTSSVPEASTPTPSTSTTTDNSNSAGDSSAVEQHDVHPLLGGWSTVAHYSKPLEPVVDASSEANHQTDDLHPEDEASTPSAETGGADLGGGGESAPPARQPGRKFKEKVLKTTISSSAVDESEPVMFKKRKSGNKNVRKRTGDDD